MPTRKVPAEARETARNMVVSPKKYQKFGNGEGILPKAGSGEYYIEAIVPLGQAQGQGQYRVVCLVSGQDKVLKKYWSPTHYGTGEDAKKKPAFIEFQ